MGKNGRQISGGPARPVFCLLARRNLFKGTILMDRNQIWCTRREVKVPRTRDKSGGHDPVLAFVNISAGIVMVGCYQVAAHTTPSPLSCPWIVLNSKSRNWEMYRTKGRISRTPLLTVAIAVRKLTTVLETDCVLYVLVIKNRKR